MRLADPANAATENEVRGLFISQGLKFKDDELEQLAQYYLSPVGTKDRDVARKVAERFAGMPDDERNRLMRSQIAVNPRVSELIRLHGIPSLLENAGAVAPVTAEQIEAVLATAYGTLSDSELDEMIRFYSSPIGQKCAGAAKNAGAGFLAHYRTKTSG